MGFFILIQSREYRKYFIIRFCTCGVADITDAGSFVGTFVVCGGCFANKDASILFFSHSLLVALFEELVPEEDTWCEPSTGRFTATFRSPSSPGLFWPTWVALPRATCSLDWDGDGVVFRNPRLLRRESLPPGYGTRNIESVTSTASDARVETEATCNRSRGDQFWHHFPLLLASLPHFTPPPPTFSNSNALNSGKKNRASIGART